MEDLQAAQNVGHTADSALCSCCIELQPSSMAASSVASSAMHAAVVSSCPLLNVKSLLKLLVTKISSC
jgi:hypothetical protein